MLWYFIRSRSSYSWGQFAGYGNAEGGCLSGTVACPHGVLWLLLFIGIQFDYLSFFNAWLMSAWLLFQRKWWVSVAPVSAAVAGIAYIVYHFSQWIGFETYMEFLKASCYPIFSSTFFFTICTGDRGCMKKCGKPHKLRVLLLDFFPAALPRRHRSRASTCTQNESHCRTKLQLWRVSCQNAYTKSLL